MRSSTPSCSHPAAPQPLRQGSHGSSPQTHCRSPTFQGLVNGLMVPTRSPGSPNKSPIEKHWKCPQHPHCPLPLAILPSSPCPLHLPARLHALCQHCPLLWCKGRHVSKGHGRARSSLTGPGLPAPTLLLPPARGVVCPQGAQGAPSEVQPSGGSSLALGSRSLPCSLAALFL